MLVCVAIKSSKVNVLRVGFVVSDDVVKNVEKVNGKYCFETDVYKNWLIVVNSWCVVYSISKQMTEEDLEVQISYFQSAD